MHIPNLETQRIAMRKLAFLTGKWFGDASVLRAPGQFVELSQTEVAQFRLDGLILMIEGIGRLKSDGTPVLQALGIISFDDETGKYHMRAFNDGRWLETEVKSLDEGNTLAWSFTLGEMSTHSVLGIGKKGEWIEHAEITIGPRPPQKLLDLTVRRIE